MTDIDVQATKLAPMYHIIPIVGDYSQLLPIMIIMKLFNSPIRLFKHGTITINMINQIIAQP